jgi:iron complex outermembrane receptor protein
MNNKSIKLTLLAALATTSLYGLAAPVFAEEATSNAKSNDEGIVEMVVSARRRNESIQTTPISMTAITAASLDARGTLNIGDLQGSVPNLLITQQNSGGAAANLSIRGLTYADIEKSQEPTVGVVVDGVFIGTSTGQYMDLFDIDTIEVLRGPQGTLFGRNTIGGVINIRRTKPTGQFGGKVEASYGSYNTWSGKAVLNVPLIKDVLAAKFFYMHNQSDGYYRNGATGARAGGNKNDNYGASFLFTPSVNFDALLTVEQQKQKFDVVNSNIANSTELFCLFEPANQCNRNTSSDLYTVFNSPATSKYRAPAVTLEMNLKADSVKLTSVTSYREQHEYQTQDFDASTTDLYYTERVQKYWQFSQEVRAAGNITPTFDYVVGGYYFKSQYDFQQWTRLFGFNTSLSPDVVDANSQIEHPKSESYAVFGDFDWQFYDKFRLSFGGRWTHDKKSLYNAFATTGVVGNGTPATFNKFTPKIGLDYRPDENSMIYASWSRGYRSGGFSPRAATADTAGTPYQPETVDSYELGFKTAMLDRKLIFNADVFYAKYKSMQQNTTVPGGPTGNQTITGNVGSATIKGFEADLTARPTRDLKLNGSIGILDSHFHGFVVGNVYTTSTPGLSGITNFDYSDNNMIYAPKVTATLGAEYNRNIGFADWTVDVSYRYIAPYDEQISIASTTPAAGVSATIPGLVTVNGNDPRVRTKAQNLVDASTSLDFPMGKSSARVTVYGRNLGNVKTTSAAFTVAGLWSFASAIEPRTVGVKLGLTF